MKSTIFIPKEIQVGYQERQGTYTGQLAYVIYYDEKGKLRKETSWNSWRDKKIEPNKYNNEPTAGFVINKKVGGYSTGWNHRNTYARIYDPRGFEFEITMENLLYILEHTNSIKGKGLEGEFVYGWDRKDHILIPASSPDYQEIKKFNEYRYNPKKFTGKDMILGATYLHKDNKELIYVGRFDYYDYGKNKGKRYFFYDTNYENEKWNIDNRKYEVVSYGRFEEINTLTKTIVDIVDETCNSEYADIRSKLEFETCFSPLDESLYQYVPYDSFEEFDSIIEKENVKDYWNGSKTFYSGQMNVKITIKYGKKESKFYKVKYKQDRSYYSWNNAYRTVEDNDNREYFNSLEDLYSHFQPKYQVKYQANGNKYEECK